MRCGILSVLVVFFLLVATALAQSDINIDPIKNSITLTETASFKLIISNNAEETQRYSIFSFVQGWDIEPFPLKDKIIEVGPQQSKTTTINIKLVINIKPNIKFFFIFFYLNLLSFL